MTTTWLTTREDVRAALDTGDLRRTNRAIDQAIATGSRAVEQLCHLATFRPVAATRYFPWPDPHTPSAWWRLWLNEHTLIAATSITSGGVAATDYNLEPVNTGPPYRSVEINLAGTSAFRSGDTFQRGISIVGLWGVRNDERPAGALDAAIASTTATTITVTDGSAVAVGDLLRVDSERLQVTDRTWGTTGTTITANLDPLDSARSITVADGTAVQVGEILLIDAERVEVTDVVGNTVTAQRAVHSSVLTAHTTGATVYASRVLTVERGACGTTPAAHTDGTSISAHTVPAEPAELALAEACVILGLRRAGYSRTAGSSAGKVDSSGTGIDDLRRSCYRAWGRKTRTY